MSETFIDPYIDPETGVLRNKVGASSYSELANAEGEFVSNRAAKLFESGPRNMTGSLEDFCAIHKELFQDIFDWAGTPRTVEIRKNSQGSEFFLPSANIATGIAWSQNELKKDNFLCGMGFEKFCERLAYHYDNYNFVHPFREGNGRTQRVFWSIMSGNAGYDIDWRCATGKENDEASRLAAEDCDLSGLIQMFRRIVLPHKREGLSQTLSSGAIHLD